MTRTVESVDYVVQLEEFAHQYLDEALVDGRIKQDSLGYDVHYGLDANYGSVEVETASGVIIESSPEGILTITTEYEDYAVPGVIRDLTTTVEYYPVEGYGPIFREDFANLNEEGSRNGDGGSKTLGREQRQEAAAALIKLIPQIF